MQPQPWLNSAGGAASRLLIHAAEPPRMQGWSVASLLRRLRSRVFERHRAAAPPLALEIHDLHGRRVLALADARPEVDVTLAPGTYHVSTQRGGARRSYTITLERGGSFELHLRHLDGAA